MSEDVLVRVSGALGRLTLNRPKALNSLTLDMIRTMSAALQRWREDDDVAAVLIDGAGERGLCAGGDVRALYDAAKAGDEDLPRRFWAEEYQLNSMLSRYPKPVVGIMDGICMGGGVGVSAHGSHRVVTERSKIGMPEVGIGFVPDVGGTYLLSRAPGETGTYLALTGLPVGPGDAIHCGLADYYVTTDQLDALVERLTTGVVDDSLRAVAGLGPPEPFAGEREWIDEAFSADTVEEVLRRLRDRPEEAAARAAAEVEAKSPTALKVTLRSLRSADQFTCLEDALQQEFRVSCSCVRYGDFLEGVRSTLVDKDRAPKWDPERLADVDDAFVAKFFEPLVEDELDLSP